MPNIDIGELQVSLAAAHRVAEHQATRSGSPQDVRDEEPPWHSELMTLEIEHIQAVHSESWWATTTPRSIGRLYATAARLSTGSAQADLALHRIQEVLRTRYGLDVDRLPVCDRQEIQDQFERYELERLAAVRRVRQLAEERGHTHRQALEEGSFQPA